MSRTINKVERLSAFGQGRNGPGDAVHPRRHGRHQAAAGDRPLPQGGRERDGLAQHRGLGRQSLRRP